MRKPAIFLLTILLAGLLGNPVLAQKEGNVILKSVAEIEEKVKGPDGQEIIVRKPAAKVLPDTEVIYTNIFTNIGKEPAENLRLDNPIPEHTAYLEGSAFGPGCDITFSVDGGKVFDNPEKLTVPGPDGRPRPATAADYTHIRWVRNIALRPGEESAVGFRVQLE